MRLHWALDGFVRAAWSGWRSVELRLMSLDDGLYDTGHGMYRCLDTPMIQDACSTSYQRVQVRLSLFSQAYNDSCLGLFPS